MRDKHPLAGQTIKVTPKGQDHQLLVPDADFVVVDYWQNVSGQSWREQMGNFAVLNYFIRAKKAGLPMDDEVVYGKIGAFGYLVHVSEMQVPQAA